MSMEKKSYHHPWRCLVFFGLWLMLLIGETGLAATRDEYLVKAVFVYNFAKYSTWIGKTGPTDDGFYDLYVIGDQVIEEAFQTIDGKKIGNGLLRVHFKRSTDNFDHSDILFISRDIERNEVLRIIAAVKGRPVLTIGEMHDFARLGGVVNLFSKGGGKVRFKINRNTARQQQLEISSRILRLAIIVESYDTMKK